MSPIYVVNITEEDYRTLRLHPAASLVYHGDLDSLSTYFEMIFESPLKGNVAVVVGVLLLWVLIYPPLACSSSTVKRQDQKLSDDTTNL